MEPTVAVVAGATGLVGRYLVDVLLEDSYFDVVVTLSRRELGFRHVKLDSRLVDFQALADDELRGASHLFCALGTTRKAAGSDAAFRAVDYDACLRFAQAGRASGARGLTLLSSVGADASSSNLYLRTKGEIERDITALNYDALHIFRPSVLMGRREVERAGEQWGARLLRGFEFALRGDWSKYRPMPAGVLASSMAASAERGGAGTHVYHYSDIVRLAGFAE